MILIFSTFDQEEQFESDGIPVTVMPVWKYFL
jgi:hypothetical protein